MAALTYAGRRVAFTFAVAPRRQPARMPATLPDMPPRTRTAPTASATPADRPMTFEERAAAGGRARAEKLDLEARQDSARKAAAGAHGLVATARKFVARWADASDEEKREARRELRKAAGLIR